MSNVRDQFISVPSKAQRWWNHFSNIEISLDSDSRLHPGPLHRVFHLAFRFRHVLCPHNAWDTATIGSGMCQLRPHWSDRLPSVQITGVTDRLEHRVDEGGTSCLLSWLRPTAVLLKLLPGSSHKVSKIMLTVRPSALHCRSLCEIECRSKSHFAPGISGRHHKFQACYLTYLDFVKHLVPILDIYIYRYLDIIFTRHGKLESTQPCFEAAMLPAPRWADPVQGWNEEHFISNLYFNYTQLAC